MARIIVTSVLNSTILLISVLLPNVSTALEFIGAIGVLSVFVFPSWCIISFQFYNFDSKITGHGKIFQIIVIAYSLLVAILSGIIFIVTLFNAFDNLGAVGNNELLCESPW